MTRVFLDRSAGLCGGVKRTLSAALKLAGQWEADGDPGPRATADRQANYNPGTSAAVDRKVVSGPGIRTIVGRQVVSYGELIHNPEVTRDLERQGILVRRRLEDIKPSDLVIIRAHGIPPADEQWLRKKGIPYLDLTCPRVKQIHQEIRKKLELGYRIIIVGDPQHPEVRGHLGYAGNRGRVLSSIQEAESFKAEYSGIDDAASPRPKQRRSILRNEKLFLFAQTTTSPELYGEIVRLLTEGGFSPDTRHTLCPFVLKRQAWIRHYAPHSAASLIIGGRNSSNTKRLFELAGRSGPAFWIDQPKALNLDKMLSFPTLAVTAGASTPDESVKMVAQRLSAGGALLEWR